jgi:ribosomal protein S18 acetylase RimI-like enzyme
MTIQYEVASSVHYDEFISVLKKSGLSERRPVDEPERIQKMLKHANLFITARDNGRLVGIARSLTDFSFICYLSDLAVDRAYQSQGIGRELMRMTSEEAGCRSILLAAPAVVEYYKHCGFKLLDNAFDFTPNI